VTVIDATSGQIVATLPVANVHEMSFSSLGSFLQTWERAGKDENGDATKNLKIWALKKGISEPELVGKFVAKSISSRLHYTPDENYCILKVTNELAIYESSDLGVVWNKVRAEGVMDFAISPGKKFAIGVFIPERKVNGHIFAMND
jgi:translation initiation factor 2A